MKRMAHARATCWWSRQVTFRPFTAYRDQGALPLGHQHRWWAQVGPVGADRQEQPAQGSHAGPGGAAERCRGCAVPVVGLGAEAKAAGSFQGGVFSENFSGSRVSKDGSLGSWGSGAGSGVWGGGMQAKAAGSFQGGVFWIQGFKRWKSGVVGIWGRFGGLGRWHGGEGDRQLPGCGSWMGGPRSGVGGPGEVL